MRWVDLYRQHGIPDRIKRPFRLLDAYPNKAGALEKLDEMKLLKEFENTKSSRRIEPQDKIMINSIYLILLNVLFFCVLRFIL